MRCCARRVRTRAPLRCCCALGVALTRAARAHNGLHTATTVGVVPVGCTHGCQCCATFTGAVDRGARMRLKQCGRAPHRCQTHAGHAAAPHPVCVWPCGCTRGVTRAARWAGGPVNVLGSWTVIRGVVADKASPTPKSRRHFAGSPPSRQPRTHGPVLAWPGRCDRSARVAHADTMTEVHHLAVATTKEPPIHHAVPSWLPDASQPHAACYCCKSPGSGARPHRVSPLASLARGTIIHDARP